MALSTSPGTVILLHLTKNNIPGVENLTQNFVSMSNPTSVCCLTPPPAGFDWYIICLCMFKR